jgi:hypothetical protein
MAQPAHTIHQQLAKENIMNRQEIHRAARVTNITVAAITAAVSFAVLVALIMIVWAMIIPDLFPGLVEQGLIAPRLTWITATGLAALTAVVLAAGRILVGAVSTFDPRNPDIR